MIGTFSIAAFDPHTKEFGVAVQSKAFAVGSVVPWVAAEVGAIATQAQTNVSYGPRGLELLHEGLSAGEVVLELTNQDKDREQRQLGVVDTKGKVASFTGKECLEWAGSKMGVNYTAQGNILSSEDVVIAMTEHFKKTEGDLADKLMVALKGGQAAGGDSRGLQSAALIVMRKGAGLRDQGDRYIDVRVDDNVHPIHELNRLLELTRTYHQTRLAWNAIKAGEYETALDHAEKGFKKTPINDEACIVLGISNYLLGDTIKAETKFLQALQINPMIKGMIRQYFKENKITDEAFLKKIFS